MKSKKNSNVTGIVKRHPDGYGFLIADDPSHPDVFIPKKQMNGVMTNDHVELEVYPEPDGSRFRGDLKKIISRNTTEITAGLYHLNVEALIVPDEFGWGEDLIVTNPKDLDFEEGHWGQIKITSYVGSDKGFLGELIKVIGDVTDPNNDNIRVLSEHTIPHEFSSGCISEAEKLPDHVLESEIKDREDLRKTPLITIDGSTAKDFDDAIFVEETGEGFRLIVAIADVSHYVKEGSNIDKDAIERGTSTYFPSFVSPMLPESLSNGLCSLRPEVDRLAFACEMLINYQGQVIEKKVFEAVIFSHARLTYGQAQDIIDGVNTDHKKEVVENVLKAEQLSRLLLKNRNQNGALQLEIPEAVIEVDKTGMPVDIVTGHRIFAHQLIEELMLVANTSVAEIIIDHDIPGIYRVHEPPKEESLALLELYLNTLGIYESLKGNKIQKKIAKALKRFKGEPQEAIINILTLRSMSQAKYAADNIGHFGLMFENYSHFTSPIRRYPDLITHRILKSILYKDKGYTAYKYDELVNLGNKLTACEQRSVKAERQIDGIKKARFMEKHIGESFDGLISSVTKFGVFVVIKQFVVDGLVKLEELVGDYYEFVEDRLCLVGRRSGFSYNIGDELKVVISSVNPELGQINLSLDPESIEKAKKAKGSQKNKVLEKLDHAIEKRSSGGGKKKKSYKKSKEKSEGRGKKKSKSGSKKKKAQKKSRPQSKSKKSKKRRR